MSEPGTPSSSDRARGSARVAAGILLSRIAGVVREALFAPLFATSAVADAWTAATRLPNLLQNLLGEGTLSASFIPTYSRFLQEGREREAARFAGAVFGLLAVVVATVVALGVLLAPWIVPLFVPGFDEVRTRLTVTLVRILFPMTGILVISAWALGILNSHRRFFLPYVAPLGWNGAMIAVLLLGSRLGGSSQEEMIRLLAWGGVVGAVLQFGIQLPTALKLLREFRPAPSTRVTGVPEALRAFLPMLAARGALNLSGYIDLILASFLAVGAPSALRYAQTLYLLPISLFGLSVAASELPELARRGIQTGRALRGEVERALVRVVYFLVPSAIAFVLLGDRIVEALYGRGDFGEDDVLLTWVILATYAIGIPASGVSRLLSSAFYALRDTKTPARAAYLRMGVSALVGAAFMFPLDRMEVGPLRLGAAGLALGASAAAWMELRNLFRALRSEGALEEGFATVRREIAGSLAAAVLAGLTGFALSRLLPPLHPWIQLGVVLPAFGGVYIGMTRALHADAPLRDLLARRGRRTGR